MQPRPKLLSPMVTRLLLAMAVVTGIGLAASPAPVHAAACCSSAAVGEAGRLLIWEKAAVGAQVSYAIGTGSWGIDGDWTRLSYDRDDELRTRIWGIVRATRRSQLSLSVPFLRQYRAAGALNERGGGVGDLSLGWRHDVLEIGERVRAPGVALRLGVVAPVGRATEDAQKTLATDVTTRGAWQGAASVALEWAFFPWFVQLDAGAIYSVPTHRDDIDARQRFGPAVTGNVLGGVEVIPGLSFALAMRTLHEAPLRIDGERVPRSARTDIGAGVSASWRFHPHVTVQAGYDSGVFVDGLGRNQAGRRTFSLGMRYGIF